MKWATRASQAAAWLLLFFVGSTGCRDGQQPDRPPEPSVPSGESTKAQIAERVQAAWLQIDSWAQQKLPELSRTLHIPATPEQISRAEERLGVRFPVDFRASLEIHNGQRRGQFFFAYQLLPLLAIERTNQPPEGLSAAALAERERQAAKAIWQKTPQEYRGRIKEDAQVLRRWIRIAGNDDFLAIDLDPGPQGHLGQIVCGGPNTQTRVIARSWGDLLHAWGDILESGQYEADLSAESPLLKPKGNVSALEALEKAAAHAAGE